MLYLSATACFRHILILAVMSSSKRDVSIPRTMADLLEKGIAPAGQDHPGGEEDMEHFYKHKSTLIAQTYYFYNN